MRDDRRNYVVVGFFVLAMLVGLVGWLAVLAGRTGATDRYHILYDNVLGLGEGTQVYYEGYRIGVVDRIGLVHAEGQQRFRVDISVVRGWRIPEDSTAEITAPGFLSAFLIDVRAGSASRALEPGSAIQGVEMANVFGLVSSVADELTRFTQESLTPLLETLSERAPDLIANLDTLTRDLNQAVQRVNRILSSENTGRVANIIANLDSTSANFADVSQGMNQTRARIDEIVELLGQMLDEDQGEAAHAIADLHDSLESVAAHIDAINYNLESTTRNLSEFSDQLRRNPGILIRGRAPDDDQAARP